MIQAFGTHPDKDKVQFDGTIRIGCLNKRQNIIFCQNHPDYFYFTGTIKIGCVKKKYFLTLCV
jgi:hypothetical protein